MVFRSIIPATPRRVFRWHQSPDALQALIPPWEPVRVVTPPPSLHDGSLAVLQVGRWPLRIRWVAEHRNFIDRADLGGEFTDVQVHGPFARWEHRHGVRPADAPEACILEDDITYRLPLAPLANPLAGWFVRRKLERMFRFRHEATARAVAVPEAGR